METWWGMGNEEMVEYAEPIPEMRPWREAGWIFRDGDAQAIARQGNRTAPAGEE